MAGLGRWRAYAQSRCNGCIDALVSPLPISGSCLYYAYFLYSCCRCTYSFGRDRILDNFLENALFLRNWDRLILGRDVAFGVLEDGSRFPQWWEQVIFIWPFCFPTKGPMFGADVLLGQMWLFAYSTIVVAFSAVDAPVSNLAAFSSDQTVFSFILVTCRIRLWAVGAFISSLVNVSHDRLRFP